ncbi:hypothetical protein Tco_0206911 [Tanacetum coccineum]
MSNMSEDIQYAGSDTRPPMLNRTDFESWQQRIRLYCLGKDNGENIMKSITEGPFQMGMFRETIAEGAEGALHLGPERVRVFTDLTAEDKERYKADIRATNILLQGIPKDIYTLINHFTDAKDIWDNVKMILEGSELTKDDWESQLYDEFEHFCQIKGETIHVYYVRFTKLINDMRNIKMTMPRMQLNSKFVNNMLPEWSRFITEVKLNRGLKESNFDQLYAYLKQHEVHANENRMMMERFSQPTNDPLALVCNASNQKYPTQSSESPQSSNQPSSNQPSLVDNFQLDSGSTSTDNLIERRPFQREDLVFESCQCDALTLMLLRGPTTQYIVSWAIYTSEEAGGIFRTWNIPNEVQDCEYDLDCERCPKYVVNKQDKVVNDSVTSELARYKELVQGCMNNGPKTRLLVHDSEDARVMAEITRKRNNGENEKASINLTPEQIFWSIDENDRKKAETSVPKPHFSMTVSSNGPRFKEVKVMEEIFDQMNGGQVDQNTVNKQYAKIVKKNLLIENENMIANCLSNKLLYDGEKSRCLDLEAEMSKVHNESKHISKLEREYLLYLQS